MEFKLSSPAGGDLEIITNAPPELVPNPLPAFKTDFVKGRFGSMYFNHYQGDGFDIWYSNYQIEHSTTIKGRADRPVLELHTAHKNSFASAWEGIGTPSKKEKQYNMSFTPHVHNKAEFIGGLHYETCDIHFTPEFLMDYSPFYPTLDKFLGKIQKNNPSTLLLEDSFLCSKMNYSINEILTNDNHPGVASPFYSARVTDLLIRMLEKDRRRRVSGHADSRQADKYSGKDRDLAHAAMEFLVSDFTKYPNIKTISKKFGVNTCYLQKVFKHYFGETIFDYYQHAKMNRAKELLLEYSIDEVTLMVGYPDKQNFHVAFKKKFGVTPGNWRKESL